MLINLLLFQSLDNCEKGHSVTVATDAVNKPLNRFNNITVCEYSYHVCMDNTHLALSLSTIDDDNRIVLQPIKGRPECQREYINASYINVCKLDKAALMMCFPCCFSTN